jgi:small subunit ribosomal protein S4
MTKIVKAKYKVSRRLLTSIWGDEKDPFNKKNYRPGQHGAAVQGKLSDYGVHLRAKQRLKFHYGRITEKQFRNIFKTASQKKGNTGDNFVAMLESRVDVALYRAGFAPSIFAARQLISHAHFALNGKKITIGSIQMESGDILSVREKSKQLGILIENAAKNKKVPDYLEVDNNDLSIKFLRTPSSYADVPYPFDPEMHLIIELYSR